MKKNNYLPFLALIAALLFFIWVKKNQSGKTDRTSQSNELIDRNATIKYSKHARCRMDCRMIDASEVKEIIAKGFVNRDRIETTDQGKTYPLEGTTHDGQTVRIVVAPHEKELVVVTVIDLGKEWPCECY